MSYHRLVELETQIRQEVAELKTLGEQVDQKVRLNVIAQISVTVHHPDIALHRPSDQAGFFL